MPREAFCHNYCSTGGRIINPTIAENREFEVMETTTEMRLSEDMDADDNTLLLTARQAAAMCAKSLRTWRSWDAAGWIPQPVRIGRSTLWRADELRAWVAASCPRRKEWEARQ